MALTSYDFLSSRRAGFLGDIEAHEPEENNYTLSLDDLHEEKAARSQRSLEDSDDLPTLNGKNSTSSRALSAPRKEEKRAGEDYLPGIAGEPMFALSRVQSGIGSIIIAPQGAMSPSRVMLLLEREDGTQEAVLGDSFYRHGICLGRNGEATLDLSFIARWRRIALLMETPFQGFISLSSDTFSWRKHFAVEAPAPMAIAPLLALNVLGRMTVRQTYVSQSIMRSTAECVGFNQVQWRDANTPLQP